MDTEHRHELKTNELADWLANLPQWAKENTGTIAYVAIVIIIVAVVAYMKYYRPAAAVSRSSSSLATSSASGSPAWRIRTAAMSSSCSALCRLNARAVTLITGTICCNCCR